MGSWYYAIRGQSYGPVSEADLRRLALDGHLSPDAVVMPVGGSGWQPISSIEWQLGLVRTEWNRYIPASPPGAQPVAGGLAPPPPPPPPPAGSGAPLGSGPPRGATAAAGRQPYASYGRRVVAYLLDGLITGALGVALIWPAGGLEFDDRGGGFDLQINTVGVLISLLIGVVYFGGLHGTSRGQTVGKMALGIRVVDPERGTSIGFARATVRYLLTVLFSMLCVVPWIIDHLWPLWDPQRQALHDKAVRSIVVSA